MMSADAQKALVRRFIDEVINKAGSRADERLGAALHGELALDGVDSAGRQSTGIPPVFTRVTEGSS
jgi:hypothetical protein